MELNPSFAPAYFTIAAGHLLAGRPEKAIGIADQALRFFPAIPASLCCILYKDGLFSFSRATKRLMIC